MAHKGGGVVWRVRWAPSPPEPKKASGGGTLHGELHRLRRGVPAEVQRVHGEGPEAGPRGTPQLCVVAPERVNATAGRGFTPPGYAAHHRTLRGNNKTGNTTRLPSVASAWSPLLARLPSRPGWPKELCSRRAASVGRGGHPGRLHGDGVQPPAGVALARPVCRGPPRSVFICLVRL